MNVNNKMHPVSIEGFPGYVIFFDSVRVDQYIESWTSTCSCTGNIGTANFSFLYIPAFDKYMIKDDTGKIISVEDGIEDMTNVRIFVKNMFNNKYIKVFEGNIRGKTIMKSGDNYTITLTATDYLTWLNRTIVPIAIPTEDTFLPGHVVKWKGQGIDTSKVDVVSTAAEREFKGKTIKEFVNGMINKTMTRNAVYSEPNSVASWDNVVNRVKVIADIDPILRRTKVIDFLVSSTANFVNSLYVAFNDLATNFMLEFFQDINGDILLKAPFWNEKILYSHVIDSTCIISYSKNTDWSSRTTRVIATGGLEEWQDNISTYDSGLMVPTGAYVGDSKKWVDYLNV